MRLTSAAERALTPPPPSARARARHAPQRCGVEKPQNATQILRETHIDLANNEDLRLMLREHQRVTVVDELTWVFNVRAWAFLAALAALAALPDVAADPVAQQGSFERRGGAAS